MRTHKLNKSRKLYRSDNTTTRHYSINPGGEYRWGRNRKKAEDELLAKRETMHGRQKRGRDYTPLFYFLVKQIGRKRAARTVLTGMCYSVGSATRQGSSSLTRFIGQSAMTSRT